MKFEIFYGDLNLNIKKEIFTEIKVSNDRKLLYTNLLNCNYSETCSNSQQYRLLLKYGFFNNKKDLKQMLLELGYRFNTNSDEEVIINLYQEFKEKLIDYIDGEMAFCVFDNILHNLSFFKTQMCPLQMYYTTIDDIFCCSTSLTSLLKLRPNKINHLSVELYLRLRFIPPPYTIVENIYKLDNSELVDFDGKNIRKKKLHYQDNLNIYNKKIEKVGKYIVDSVEKTQEKLKDSGIFLSGGFDSGIIASIISNKNKIPAFSVGYEVDTIFDETEKASRISKCLNFKHYIYKIRNEDLLRLIDEVMEVQEEPFYSTVSISTLKLAKEASKHVKYIYTGDGSDELFFGYKYLRESVKNLDPKKKYLEGMGWLKDCSYDDILFSTTINNEDIENFLLNKFENDVCYETFRRSELFIRFPYYHLYRVGKIFNKFDLEVVAPFVSRDLIKYSLCIDGKTIMNDDDPKSVLKSALSDYLIEDLRIAKKQPFTAPNKEWIEGQLKDDINKLFNQHELFEILHIKIDTCKNMLKNYTGSNSDVSNIWGIYMILKWLEKFKKYIIQNED